MRSIDMHVLSFHSVPPLNLRDQQIDSRINQRMLLVCWAVGLVVQKAWMRWEVLCCCCCVRVIDLQASLQPDSVFSISAEIGRAHV